MVAKSYRRMMTVCPKPIWIFQPGGTRELEPTITLERVARRFVEAGSNLRRARVYRHHRPAARYSSSTLADL